MCKFLKITEQYANNSMVIVSEIIQKSLITLKGLMNKENQQIEKFVLLVFCGLFLCSCVATTHLNYYTPEYTVEINSFGNYDLSGKTFYIESGDENISSGDAEFREYAKYVAISLGLQGAQETLDKKNADMCILMNYGIYDESYTATVPFPIWGQTGISSISTTSNTTGSAYGSASGSSMVIGGGVYSSGSGSVYGSATTTTKTTVNPTYGITGYTSINRKVKKFRRVLNIYSYDNRHTAEPTMLWKTNLVSYGNSNKIKEIIPYMAYTAWGEMGKSNAEAESYTVLENDFFFYCWSQGILNQPNISIFPNVDYSNISPSIQIAIVERTNNATTVILRKDNCMSWSLDANIYIEYEGQKHKVKNARNVSKISAMKQNWWSGKGIQVKDFQLGKVIKKECGARYIRLEFPPIPSYVNSINIREERKKGYRWDGVKIQSNEMSFTDAGVSEKEETAKEYRKRAEQGDAQAQAVLGLMYAKGEGVNKDYEEAVKWFRKSAEQGNASAQYSLGVMYYNGDGVSKDYEEAVKWYRKSAEQGNASAQCNLGWMYAHGNGVSKDYEEAVKWYRKSAEQCHARSQNNLGVMYENGNGVSQNYEEAMKWFRKSAEQGNASAQSNLGWMKELYKKDFQEALKDYTAAIEIDNDHKGAYMKRGRLYQMQLNQPKLAEKDFLTVLTLENEIQESGNCRQYALFYLGKTDDAIAYQNSILSKYPTYGNYYDAACLYSLMNRSSEAIAYLRTSFEKGYRNFAHIEVDTDLDNIRNMPEFIKLIKEWKK